MANFFMYGSKAYNLEKVVRAEYQENAPLILANFGNGDEYYPAFTEREKKESKKSGPVLKLFYDVTDGETNLVFDFLVLEEAHKCWEQIVAYSNYFVKL